MVYRAAVKRDVIRITLGHPGEALCIDLAVLDARRSGVASIVPAWDSVQESLDEPPAGG